MGRIMANRIPVDRAIADGYVLGFRHYLAVLGVVWLPYLVCALLSVGLLWLLVPGLKGLLTGQELDFSAMMGLGRAAVLIVILVFITDAMVTVGVQRRALGLSTRPVWAWFSLGAPVWRMAGALFVASLVVFIVALVTGLVCVAIWAGVSSLGGAMWPLRILAMIAACVAVLYVGLRLMFFLPPAVVAEGSFGLERAWTLGRGNVVRSFIVLLAVILPTAFVFHLVERAIFGSAAAFNPTLFSARELTRAVLLQVGAVGPIAILLSVVERILLVGLANGAMASAWRAVTAAREQPAAPAVANPAA